MIFACDVDGTLVSLKKFDEHTEGTIPILNPYVNQVRHVKVHDIHVDLIKEMLGRGRFIIVWSGSGVKWAREVLKATGIDHRNILVMTKPIGYLDDLECNEWLKNRIFLNQEGLEHE